MLDSFGHRPCAAGAHALKVWSRQVFDGLPTDAYTVSATEDFLVIPMADPRIHWRPARSSLLVSGDIAAATSCCRCC